MRRSVTKAVLFGATAGVTAEVLDLAFHSLGMPWQQEVSASNLLYAILIAAVSFHFLEERRRHAEQRVEELAYLNHHIRNALTAIKLARYAPDEDMKLQIISDASDRIEMTIRRMSQQENVRLSDRPSTVP